jgi:hypothetical protein
MNWKNLLLALTADFGKSDVKAESEAALKEPVREANGSERRQPVEFERRRL